MKTEQKWEDFGNALPNKKVIVLGLARNVENLLMMYGETIDIDAFIDNNPAKWGTRVGDVLVCMNDSRYKDMRVLSCDYLDGLDCENVIILIGGKRSYREIEQQVTKKGYSDIFIIELMGAQIRNDDFLLKQKDYARICTKEPLVLNKIIVEISTSPDHLIAITKSLLKYSDMEIVWVIRANRKDVPDGVRTVFEADWKKYIYELETSKVWLFDTTLPLFANKRCEQICIMTKHWSSITLKKFGLEAKETYVYGEAYNTQGVEMVDYIFSGSEFDEEACRRGFGYNGRFIRIGSPRSDLMFRSNIRQKVFHEYGLSIESRLLLYAPTHRKKGEEIHSYELIDLERTRSELEEKTGERWISMVRWHPLDAMNELSDSFCETINASGFDSGEELVAAADVLISDYSSIMFEMAFVGKPVFIYAPDRKEYLMNERGFLIDIDSLPFQISGTNEELLNQIKSFDLSAYKKRVERFLDSYGIHEDGHASERAADFITKLLKT